jgi:hypothetical protein
MLTALAKYFNLILDTSVYPDKWNQSYIIPIFKSGEQFNLMNYRGISLMNCLSKIFNSVINNRLLDIILYEHKINPSQFGFRKKQQDIRQYFLLSNH